VKVRGRGIKNSSGQGFKIRFLESHTLKKSSYGTLEGRKIHRGGPGRRGTVCGRIKISCLFWLLFVIRQKVTQGIKAYHLITRIEYL
jgi:hypothetical protein